MSVGNLKTQGNKGNNFPYQLSVLKVLGSISSIISGGTSSQVRTPTLLRTSGSGTIAAGAYSMSFASVGTANATVGGMILKPGETVNFDAGAINNTLAAVAYNATTAGAELIITTLT